MYNFTQKSHPSVWSLLLASRGQVGTQALRHKVRGKLHLLQASSLLTHCFHLSSCKIFIVETQLYSLAYSDVTLQVKQSIYIFFSRTLCHRLISIVDYMFLKWVLRNRFWSIAVYFRLLTTLQVRKSLLGGNLKFYVMRVCGDLDPTLYRKKWKGAQKKKKLSKTLKTTYRIVSCIKLLFLLWNFASKKVCVFHMSVSKNAVCLCKFWSASFFHGCVFYMRRHGKL